MAHAGIRAGVAVLAAALLWGCTRSSPSLTVVMALLPGELPVVRSVLADFERERGIEVQLVAQQYAEIRRAVAAESAAARGTIDLAEFDVYSLAPVAAQMMDLRRPDAGGPHPALGDILPALEPAARRAGALDGLRFLPLRVAWQAMLYDHEVLGKPPQTWEELLAVARAHPGKVGLKAALYEGATCDVLPFVWAAGGDGISLRDAGAEEAFRFLAELAPFVDPHSATFKEATIAEAMARRELVVEFNWPFAMALYADQGLAPQRIRSAPIPAGPRGRATVLGGGYLGIPAHAPNPGKAAELLAFLLSEDVQRRLRDELGWFSARHDVPVGTGAGTGLLAGFEAMRHEVRARPEISGYPALSRAWQQALRGVLFDRLPAHEALQRAEAQLGAR